LSESGCALGIVVGAISQGIKGLGVWNERIAGKWLSEEHCTESFGGAGHGGWTFLKQAGCRCKIPSEMPSMKCRKWHWTALRVSMYLYSFAI